MNLTDQWRTERGGFGVFKPPPRNSEDIGGVLDRMSKKSRRLDSRLQFTVFSYGCNLLNKGSFNTNSLAVAYLVSEFNPTPTSRKFDKIKPECKLSGKCLVFHSNILISLKIAEFRTPTPQDVRKKGSKILKLPPVHYCFTLTMTNKLVVVINSLKYQKLRKFYYMK